MILAMWPMFTSEGNCVIKLSRSGFRVAAMYFCAMSRAVTSES